MSRTVHEIVIGSNEEVMPLYYGFDNTSDNPQTSLNTSYKAVIHELIGQEPEIQRDDLIEIAENLKPLVEVTPEGIHTLQVALSSLQQGEDIPIQQKQALYHYEKFVDAVIDEGEVTYEELTSDMVIHYLAMNGLDQEVVDYLDEGGDINVFLSDRLTYPVFSEEAITASAGQEPYLFDTEVYDNMPGRRKVASLLLLIKTRLAVGALYAAGMEGDRLAAAVANGLDPLIRI